ncbi:hypothetical protein [Fimbriimonas ginsengisoli]|nr:hypothetical protein [Fimbriimonas ginsengisoli]
MEIGTKSVLFGAHCWFIHPWFVARAWTKLYGFPKDYRLWVAFFVHDLGYLGKPNMDGPEGETHVEFGANLMHRWFDVSEPTRTPECDRIRHAVGHRWCPGCISQFNEWRNFCLYHSRFYAKRDRQPFSRLCVADKLAVALEPWWLYLPRVIATGEIREYMALARHREGSKYSAMQMNTTSPRAWFETMGVYLRAWAYEHADGRPDTWTPELKAVQQ